MFIFNSCSFEAMEVALVAACINAYRLLPTKQPIIGMSGSKLELRPQLAR